MRLILFLIYGVTIPLIIATKPPGFNPFSCQEIIVNILMLLTLFLIPKSSVGKNVIYLIPLGIFFLWVVLNGLRSYNVAAFFASLSLHFKYITLLVTVILAPSYRGVLLKIFIPYIAVGLILFFIKGDFSPTLLLSSGRFMRSSFGFTNVNVAGLFFGMNFLIIDLFKDKRIYGWLRLLKLPFLMALLLTFSRRSMVFIFPAFIRKKLFWLMMVLGVYITPFGRFFEPFVKRFLLIFDSSYESNSVRVSQLNHVLTHDLGDFIHFIIGLGPGNIGPASNYGIPYVTRLDNHLLLIFAEFGLLGLLFYASFFVILFVKAAFSKALVKRNKNILVLIFLCLITGLTGTGLLSFPINLIFWALVAHYLSNHEKEDFIRC